MLTLVLPVLLLGSADNATATVPKPQRVCREVKLETGSHIRAGKRCKTAEEWAREDEKNSHMPIDAAIRHNEGDVAADLARPH